MEPGDEVEPIIGEIMTSEEVDALLAAERVDHPAGSIAHVYVFDTPIGPVYLKARNIDEAMMLGECIQDAGYPRRA